MRYYPTYLNLKGRTVLIVGAGEIALGKIKTLLDCEALLRVVSPDALPDVQTLSRDKKIQWFQREYETADLADAWLVIAATNDKALQERIASEARERRIWVNIVDVTPLCDFITPAVVSRDDLQIAVSTGGAAPALAKFVRRKLEPLFGAEYGDFTQMVKRYRPDILKLPKPQRDQLWQRLASEEFLNFIKENGIDKAEKTLKEWMYGNPVI